MTSQEKIIKDIQKFYEEDFKGKVFAHGGEASLKLGSFSTHKDVVVKFWVKEKIKKVKTTEVYCLWKYSHHPNIVRFFGILMAGTTMSGVVMEYLENGSLHNVIHPTNDQRMREFSSRRKLEWIVQASYALQYLHSVGVAHRDISLNNMLLSDNYKILKICDFGLTKDYNMNVSSTVGGEGTAFYMAPEKIKPREGLEENKFKSDVYSLSICAYEILSGKIPYDLPENYTIYTFHTKIIDEHLRPSFEKANIKIEIQEFLKKGWDGLPEKRATTAQVVEFYEKELAEETEDVLPEETQHSNPILSDKGDIYAKIVHYIASNKNCNLLTQKVTKHFEEELLKKDLFDICSAEDESSLMRLRENLEKSHEKIEKCRGLDDNWPFGVDKPDWRKIIDRFNEIQDFLKKKLFKIKEIETFISECNKLEERAKQTKTFLENEDYGRLKTSFEEIVKRTKLLDEEQTSNEKFYKEYSYSGLRDRLEVPKQIINEIEKWFLDLHKETRSSAKELEKYLNWCRMISSKILELNEEDLFYLIEDVENHRNNFSQRNFQLLRRVLTEFGGGIHEVEESLQLVGHFQNELHSLSNALSQTKDYLSYLHSLERSFPDCSLLDKTNPEISIEQRCQNTARIANELSNLSVQSFECYFMGQMERLMSRHYETAKLKYEEISENNSRILSILENK